MIIAVSIWLGAMDHHGHMEASGHQVHVSVRDPGNVTVKYWHHRLLWPGLTNFLFELSERPANGMWTVHVSLADAAYADERRHERQVSFAVLADDHIYPVGDADDAEVSNSTAVYAAESHFVELNFSPRTAVHFQPHLPFAGEVLQPRINRINPRQVESFKESPQMTPSSDPFQSLDVFIAELEFASSLRFSQIF